MCGSQMAEEVRCKWGMRCAMGALARSKAKTCDPSAGQRRMQASDPNPEFWTTRRVTLRELGLLQGEEIFLGVLGRDLADQGHILGGAPVLPEVEGAGVHAQGTLAQALGAAALQILLVGLRERTIADGTGK